MRSDHPTVRLIHESQGNRAADAPQPLDASWLRQLCLECGADDAGLVEISRPALDDQRADILRAFPPAKTLVRSHNPSVLIPRRFSTREPGDVPPSIGARPGASSPRFAHG
jgi:hypothetical protein